MMTSQQKNKQRPRAPPETKSSRYTIVKSPESPRRNVTFWRKVDNAFDGESLKVNQMIKLNGTATLN